MRVLKSIFVGIFALCGFICILPIAILYFMIKFIYTPIADIWEKE